MTHRFAPARPVSPSRWSPVRHTLGLLLCAGLASAASTAWAEGGSTGKIAAPTPATATSTPTQAQAMGQMVREAIEQVNSSAPPRTRKGKSKAAAETPKVAITIEAEPTARSSRPRPAVFAKPSGALANPVDSRAATRTAALAAAGAGAHSAATASLHSTDVPWSYAGDNGPQTWARLHPEFATCANGMRQSPIDIQDSTSLQGPAEPLLVRYQPSGAMVVNNGRTLQVDVVGDNLLTVRGTVYKLYQMVFHHPSEVRVNGRASAMEAHLMHRDVDGQVAVVAVRLDPGQANALVHKVWTYMPLDVGDRVRMPAALLDLNELLPQDMRYYQFMGSLTTPPCSEGVLWMVLKQPVEISPEQLRLFGQLFPQNARPVQPLNGRVVRDAQ